MKSPTVLLICPGGTSSFAGGIGRLMANLAEAWSGDPEAPDFVMIDPRGSGSVLWSPFYLIWACGEILWYAGTRRIWLFHINISERASVARKAVIVGLAALLGKPAVLHLHGPEFIEFFEGLPEVLRCLVRILFRRVACNIVLGERWRGYLTERLRVSRDRIELLYNAAPHVARRTQRADGKPCRLLFLGNLSERKGVPELFAALTDDGIRSKDWVLTLAGGGDVNRFRGQSERMGLSSHMRFLGWVDPGSLHELLTESDVLVLPSRNEALPMAIVEALGAGLAVVATPVGAVPEFLTDEISALLVPTGDIPALANALQRMIDDPSLRQRLAVNGAAVFDRLFAIEGYSSQLLNIYRRHCGMLT